MTGGQADHGYVGSNVLEKLRENIEWRMELCKSKENLYSTGRASVCRRWYNRRHVNYETDVGWALQQWIHGRSATGRFEDHAWSGLCFVTGRRQTSTRSSLIWNN